MSTPSSVDSRPQHPACDLCHARKVRCDRQDPCGNCQDANTACRRQRPPRRHRKELVRRSPNPQTRSSRESRPIQPALQQPEEPSLDSGASHASRMDKGRHPSHAPSEPQGWISLVPLTDAQISGTLYQFDCVPGLTLDRRQALESALRVASNVSESVDSAGEGSSIPPSGADGSSKIPGAEFLSWMLRDIECDRFGAFVQDYFRHVSLPSLKKMGLALLRREVSAPTSTIYTVCVNAVAYKFLTTVLTIDGAEGLTEELRASAQEYRASAQAALKQIPLVAPPSLALLQAMLCGIFLHQGSGDTTLCWGLTKAACRACLDLGLDAAVLQGTSVSSEAYYCFLWCYMLDKNYASKTGRCRSSLNVSLGTDLQSSPFPGVPMAGLLEVYVDLARIQAVLLPYLEGSSANCRETAVFDDVGDELLSKMNQIHSKIDHIASPSPLWKGLDMQSEIAALEFSFHSVMTAIFHLRQVTSSQTAASTELYLQSARQPLSALVSMCLSCDKQSTVAFLHWTLLFYPLTAYFALFCNVVTTANVADFQLLSTIADCLVHSGAISPPIAQLQSLFRKLVSLAQCFLPGHRRSIADEAATMPAHVPSEDARAWPSWPYWGEAGAGFPAAMVAPGKDDNASFLDFPAWDPFLVVNENHTFIENGLGS
ncbi:hypothetical protein P170DRAFT_469090 [Aspergillus steynii IBT 23096]|uniref:Zn(2)-C6 fungal-type domain-containing protein n=1 Tax=Aspergillus steynii IBT 23096 TaxID=1392250 RepID=A0A2I2GL45_9EURO|nr:uncharacterized protein P170DRAFT_469090 [Aspergillus steynii IBT 23096]PLB53602.1 hypothetical protein P170DRAFT_469090 [Aspergillus steynii IBT 23096]